MYGGRFCEGLSRSYKLCNTADCPQNAVDFRATQCAEFNSKPFRGWYYKWKPYIHVDGWYKRVFLLVEEIFWKKRARAFYKNRGKNIYCIMFMKLNWSMFSLHIIFTPLFVHILFLLLLQSVTHGKCVFPPPHNKFNTFMHQKMINVSEKTSTTPPPPPPHTTTTSSKSH